MIGVGAVVALIVVLALVFVPGVVVTGALVAAVVSLVRRSPAWWRWALLFAVALVVFTADPSGVSTEVTFK